MHAPPAADRWRWSLARPISRHVLALGVVGIATAVRLALDPIVNNQAVYVIYTGATVVVAWFCGRNPAVGASRRRRSRSRAQGRALTGAAARLEGPTNSLKALVF